MSSTLLLRADAGAGIGSGHVMRCLALAEAWNDAGGQALFATTNPDSAVFQRAAQTAEVLGVPGPAGGTADAEATAKTANERGASWVVADGYEFGGDYQRRVKSGGLRLLSMDDGTVATHWCSDLVLNQNLHADESLYADRDDHTQLLLGTRFILLRQEFLRAGSGVRTVAEQARNVLVTLGGSDPKNVSAKMLEALQATGLADLDCTVIAGPDNPHLGDLSSLRERISFAVRLQRDTDDMAQLMNRADIGVVAGGITTWEALYMALPIITIFSADNQRLNAEGLGPIGAALSLGSADTFDPAAAAGEIRNLVADLPARSAMSATGRKLVDGDGVYRVIARLKGEKLRLRRATAEDSQQLLEWANDPEVRAVSFSSEPIAPEEHEVWLARTLESPERLLFIAMDQEDRPVGQVRFDLDGNEAVISVAVDAAMRGSGVGTALIESGVHAMTRSEGARAVKAFVRPENRRSSRAFEKAGFKGAGEATVKGQPALVYIWEANHSG